MTCGCTIVRKLGRDWKTLLGKGVIGAPSVHIFPEWAKSSKVDGSISPAVKALNRFPTKTFHHVHLLVPSTFSGKLRLHTEGNGDLWSPIFNDGFVMVDGRANDGGHGVYT